MIDVTVDLDRPAPSRRRTRCAAGIADLAAPLLRTLRQVESQARREQRSIPTPAERRQVRAEFWRLMNELPPYDTAGPPERQALHAALHPWLLRSRLWHRAYAKPHGYPGDYRMVEWMYDMETDQCDDPTRAIGENLLDDLLASVHSVHAVWHRRKAFAQAVTELLNRTGQPVRVLDVASGGARYLRDAALAARPGQLRVTLVDQDPAALAYAAPRLRIAGTQVHTVCTKVRTLKPDALPGMPYDLVISTGLLDYLPNADAASLIATMRAVTTHAGTITVCNFSPNDPSRVVKDWVVDWPLIYRNADELIALWPEPDLVAITHSPDRGLLYATQRTKGGA